MNTFQEDMRAQDSNKNIVTVMRLSQYKEQLIAAVKLAYETDQSKVAKENNIKLLTWLYSLKG